MLCKLFYGSIEGNHEYKIRKTVKSFKGLMSRVVSKIIAYYLVLAIVATGRSFLDHSLHEPTYNFGISIPAWASASNV